MRARLLENTERVAKSGDRLQSGLKVALQTEEVGGSILNDLSEQREKLQRSRNRVSTFHVHISVFFGRLNK